MTRALDSRFIGYKGRDIIYSPTAHTINPDTGNDDVVDLTDLEITVVVKTQSDRVVWTGTVGDGVTLTGVDGEYTFWIPEETSATLDPGPYKIGADLSDGTVRTQHFVGTLTILDGVS